MLFLLLKTKTVFFIGFTLGSILALLSTLAEDLISEEAVCDVGPLRLFGNKKNEKLDDFVGLEKGTEGNNLLKEVQQSSYQKWLQSQNVQTSKLNMDELVYGKNFGPTERSSQVIESNWLKSKVRITCVVFVEKLKLAVAIKNTWASHCNSIHYFGTDKEDNEIPVIRFDIKLTSSWQLLCESIGYIWKKSSNDTQAFGTKTSNATEWLIFVKDDMMVIPENLRYLVAPLDSEEGYYLGHPVNFWGQAYNVAQAGYVLSKGAFLKIATMFNTREKCAAGGKYWKKEDYYLGKHLGTVGIHPMDMRDSDLSGIFHGYSLQVLLWGVAKSGSYWTHALYPIGPHCCSPKSVTFNVGEADKMYHLYYMLYRLNIYQDDGTYGNRPAPTAVPDQEMWKTILKEEFNITNLNHISSQGYYKIWRDRYSDPEQFIMNNYKNMPDVLSSVLTAYEAERKWNKTNTSIT